jgi:acetylornithine/N-succinyldiaminopimelate aminotransferase
MTAGSHGSTFGGNPLAMAVANANLDVLTSEGFLDNVIRSGDALRAGLHDISSRYPGIITDIRGNGLMIGMVVDPAFNNGQLGDAARDEGLLTVVAGENVLRMLPPLIIGESEIAEAIDAIDKACAVLASAGDA